MWSHPRLNVETHAESLRSPRSGVVAHRPPRSLVHLSQISGPVRYFFLFLPVLGHFVCLVGWRPCGETVSENVAPGRLEVLGTGRRGGFFGLGSFDPDGLLDVVGVEQVGWDADHTPWHVATLGKVLSDVRLVGSGKNPASRIASRSQRQPFRV